MLAELWDIREFRRLLAARVISSYGNGMAPIALSFGILGLEGATPKDLSFVIAAQSLSLVVFLPFGGVWADRFARARVISTTDMILSVFITLAGFLFITNNVRIPYLVVIGIIAGALNALWWPAFPGLTPEVVRDQHLQKANGALAMGSNMAMIAGTASGGLLVALLGAGYALAIDGMTFFVAGALVYSIRHVSKPHPAEAKPMLTELRAGWKVFIGFRWIAVIVGAFSIITMMWTGANGVLGPVLMKREYNGPTSWAIITGAVSVGMLMGAVIGSRIKPKRPMVIAMSMSINVAIWIFTMAAGAPILVIVAAAFMWGVTIEMFGIFWFTALQTHVPPESLSRVASYDAFGSMLFGPIGAALAGPAVEWVGLHTALWIAGCVIVVMVFLPLLEREVWRVRWISGREELETQS